MTEEYTHKGFTFTVTLTHDDGMGPPWKEHEGHGPVTDWLTRDKYPGEMVLSEDRGSKRFYDFQAAVKIAKKEGWDTAPYNTGTRGERAARAAMADFKYLKDWCDDKWWWCYVEVALTDNEGAVLADGALCETLGGVSSDEDITQNDYLPDMCDTVLDRVTSIYIDGNY